MRRFETPYVADWLAASLRWIVLVGLIIALSPGGQLSAAPRWPLILMFAWNIVMSLLAAFSIRARVYHRQLVLAVDFLLAALFFWSQGGLTNAAAWVGLMPILTGAVYFEIWGALAVSALFAVWQFAASGGSLSENLSFDTLSKLGSTLLIGLAAGLGGRLLMRRLRFSRQTRLDVEEHSRHVENERLRAI